MNRDFAIIDANINRAREGLRVVEDICRFVLRDRVLFENVKNIRHSLIEIEQTFGPASALSSRQGEDIGLQGVVESEYQRSSVYEVVRANCSRVSESLRVLEELAKVYHQSKVQFIENCRYQVYTLERKVLMKIPHFWLKKYFEEGIVYPISDDVQELIWLVEHGAKVIQLRDKDSERSQVFRKARELCNYLQDRENDLNSVLLIINDYIDIASRLPVAGVHIGREDGTIEKARWMLGTNKIIGTSNSSLDDVQTSADLGADYAGVGAVYSTPTKPERKAIGLEIIQECAKYSTLPLVAIGGIDKNNARDVYDTGVKNVAVVRAGRDFFN